jgi:hypothetical protein
MFSKLINGVSKLLKPKSEYTRPQDQRLIEAGWWAQKPYWVTHARPMIKEVTPSEHRVLTSAANRIYWNYGPVQAGIDAKGTYAVGRAFRPVFAGKDKEWGKQAEEWLDNWQNVAFIDGVDWTTGLWRMSVAVDRDGDQGLLLTETKAGYPQLQSIPWHAIGPRKASEFIEDGPYKGLRQHLGVAINSQGRPVGYHIVGATEEQDQWVSATSLMLVRDHPNVDFYRGLSSLTTGIMDLRAAFEIGRNIKQAAQLASTLGLIVHNEMGMADPLDQAFAYPDVPPPGQSGLRVEERMGGTIQYFRAGAQEKLEQLKNEIPTEATDRLVERLIRQSLLGAGLPVEWFWENNNGGADVRATVEKVNRIVKDRQDVLRMNGRRAIGYVVSKAIKLGQLPPYKGNDPGGFLKWSFTTPPILTVDSGRVSAAQLDAYRAGMVNMTEIAAEGGKTLDQHLDEREAEMINIRERCARSGLPFSDFVLQTPNGNVAQPIPAK